MAGGVTTLLPGRGMDVPGALRADVTLFTEAALAGRLTVAPYDDRGLPISSPYLSPRGDGRMSVEALQGPLVLRVVAADGAGQLPAGSTVQLQLVVQLDDGDREQVLSHRVDVSGLPHADLLTLEPAGGAWRVGNPLPVAVDDDDLTGVAGMVRAATRTVVGAPRVRTEHRRRTLVVVDRSASMQPAVASGLVGQVIDVVRGVDGVFGTGDEVTVWTCGPVVRREPGDVEAVTARLPGTAEPPGSGFSLRGVMDVIAGEPGPATVYVVTDDLPPDADRAAAAVRAAGGDRRWVVLALARSRFDGFGETRGLGPATDAIRRTRSGELDGLTVVSVAPDALGAESLTQDRVRRLVAALTASEPAVGAAR